MPGNPIQKLSGRFDGALLLNSRLQGASEEVAQRSCFTPEEARRAYDRIAGWPDYDVTPLRKLPELARKLGLGALLCKDEGRRLGLASFKAVGAIYASVTVVGELLARERGRTVDDIDLLQGRYRDQLGGTIFVCATDGNHGFSVASAARRMGCKARIYIPSGVSPGREAALRSQGAEVVRINGIYEEAYEAAEAAARSEPGAVMISDSATPHYQRIPGLCMSGYSVIAREIVDDLDGNLPTHMMLPAGCGGMAAAMIASLHQLLGEQAPAFIIVEPLTADCVFQSALAGQSVRIGGDLETIMGGLSCAAVSHVAWPILEAGAKAFLRISDEAAAEAMKAFGRPTGDDPRVIAGETGAAGLAGVLAICDDPAARRAVGLDESARVLVINCEGATDAEEYRRLTGQSPETMAVAAS